jgi:hypothetical protein
VVDVVAGVDVRVRTRPLTWVPRQRVYVALFPARFPYGATSFEDSDGEVLR